MSKLKEERLKKGLTQAQLSALKGLAPQDISALENGWRRPFPVWRKKLSQALDKTESELFPEVK
jgi:transcriptional regulator with XRE-family HTH domain